MVADIPSDKISAAFISPADMQNAKAAALTILLFRSGSSMVRKILSGPAPRVWAACNSEVFIRLIPVVNVLTTKGREITAWAKMIKMLLLSERNGAALEML
jgi:hypothetical protein